VSNKKLKSVLFISTGLSTFIQKDIDLLNSNYSVRSLVFRSSPKYNVPFEFIRHLFILLFSISRQQFVIAQFAGYHTFWPAILCKLFNKPFIIICGGTECVSFPNIGYGNFNKSLLGWFTKLSIKQATHLLPKHHTLIDYHYTYDDKAPEQQGLKAFINPFSIPYTVIENGFEAKQYMPANIQRIKSSFITVAAGIELPFTFALKGLDLVIEAAKHFPDSQFTIVGINEGFIPPVQLHNLKWLSSRPNSHLDELFLAHEYYLQLSMSEGFPNAICEAMLCGCIPIGSRVNAIPDIIGDCGFLLEKRDAKLLIELLETILRKENQSLSAKSVERINTNYNLGKRKEKMLNTIQSIVK